MKAWITSKKHLKALYKLGLVESPNVEKVGLPILNFPEEKIQTLTFRQRKVLELRFIKGYSLERSGRECGVTRERIRQIELEALRALLRPPRKKKKTQIIIVVERSLIYKPPVNEEMLRRIEEKSDEFYRGVDQVEIGRRTVFQKTKEHKGKIVYHQQEKGVRKQS